MWRALEGQIDSCIYQCRQRGVCQVLIWHSGSGKEERATKAATPGIKLNSPTFSPFNRFLRPFPRATFDRFLRWFYWSLFQSTFTADVVDFRFQLFEWNRRFLTWALPLTAASPYTFSTGSPSGPLHVCTPPLEIDPRHDP